MERTAELPSDSPTGRSHRHELINRVWPFAFVALLGLATIPLGARPERWLLTGMAIALTVALALAELFVPWHRLPSVVHAFPPVAYVVSVELLLQAQGGTVAGYIALFTIPVVWASLYGTREHMLLVGISVTAAVSSPLLLETEPVNGNEVRRAVLWSAVVFLVGYSITNLMVRLRAQKASAEQLAATLGQREKEILDVLDTSRDAIVRFNAAGVFEYASPAVRGVYGWEPEELVGTTAYAHIHPDDLRELLSGGLENPQEGPGVATSSFRYLRKDGTYSWLEGHRVARYDAAGTVIGFQSTVRNVDDRKLAEARHRLAEKRFEDAFANAPIGMAIVALDGSFTSANDALCKILGRDRSAVLTSTFQELTHPDDLSDDLELVRSTLAGERAFYQMEKRYVRPDGTLVPANLHVSLVRDEAGAPLYFISQIVDVSDLTQALASSRSSELRITALLESAPVAVLETDDRGNVVYSNSEWRSLTGLRADESLGDGWRRAIHPDDVEDIFARGRRAAAESSAWDYEYRVVRQDGEIRWVAGRAVPLYEEGTARTGYLSTGQDVTERHVAEDRLRESEANLKTVADAVRTLGSSADPRLSICQTAASLSDAVSASLLEVVDGEITVTASTDAVLAGRKVIAGEPSGAAVVMETGEVFRIEDVSCTPELSTRLAARGLRGCVFEPVGREGAVVGVLTVSWGRPLSDIAPSEVRAIELLATETASLIERGDLLRRLDRLARRDALTGLENRRVWDEELPREVERAGRTGRPLSIAMIDLDHFKRFNDTRGHQAGDDLLAGVAAGWTAALRSSDRLVRYGGEEFAMLLPDCDLDSAAVIANRFRTLVPEGQTCSIGLAQWHPGEDADAVLARADRALYGAKETGRDRVELAAA